MEKESKYSNTNKFSYRYFKNGIEKLMVLNLLDDETKNEYINEWYIMFREQQYKTVEEFVESNFPLIDVNENTHDFWRRIIK